MSVFNVTIGMVIPTANLKCKLCQMIEIHQSNNLWYKWNVFKTKEWATFTKKKENCILLSRLMCILYWCHKTAGFAILGYDAHCIDL